MIIDIPCKIGDVAWVIKNYGGIKHIKSGQISEMYFIGEEMRLCVVVKGLARGVYGKAVFGTYEEAEKRLIECQKKG